MGPLCLRSLMEAARDRVNPATPDREPARERAVAPSACERRAWVRGCVKGALQLLSNRDMHIRFAHVHERVLLLHSVELGLP